MKITEVEIGYAETVSLPGYNNVRPSTRLVAQVGWDQAGQHEYDEDPDLVVADLQSMARQIVHDEVDRALIAIGMAPRYWEGPRFQVMEGPQMKVVAVFPDEQDWDELPGNWAHTYMGELTAASGLVLEQARALAQVRAKFRKTYIDCSDGDLTRLPEPPAQEEEPDPCEPDDYDDYDDV